MTDLEMAIAQINAAYLNKKPSYTIRADMLPDIAELLCIYEEELKAARQIAEELRDELSCCNYQGYACEHRKLPWEGEDT